MTRDFTCIVCPNGCDLTAEFEQDEKGVRVLSVSGNLCPNGDTYARQELTAPMRTVATSVLVEDGETPLVSVRLDNAIPKERIFDVIAEIRRARIKAPVVTGQVIIENVLGLQSNVIATKDIAAK